MTALGAMVILMLIMAAVAAADDDVQPIVASTSGD
jgi:hypothetical protein